MTKLFWRRLAALCYDSLLLLSLLIIAIALLLPFHKGTAFAPHNWLLTTYLFSISFLFFGWFWTHGGQTLGMRAWHLQLQSQASQLVTWRQAFLRFITALPCLLLGGIGFLWLLLDKDGLTWYDRLSKTRIILSDGCNQ